MIGPEDNELIHRALDGALSPEEAEQFRARLAADPELLGRAESLQRLAAAVDGLGAEESPSGFSDRVMAEVQSAPSPRPAGQRRLASLPAAIGHQLFPWFAHRSEQGTRTSDSFRRAGMAGGGVIVAKKVLWGVAGLAVVVILSVVVPQWPNGGPGCPGRHRRGRSLSRRAALERRRQDGQCPGVPPERHVRQDRQEQGNPEPAQRRGAVQAAGRRQSAGGAEGPGRGSHSG